MTDEEQTLEHIDYDRIEQEINDAVAVSLGPRGADVLYDVIARLGLPAGAVAIDVGCGAGRQAVELAHRFSFDVLGIDPEPRFEESGESAPASVSFRSGTAEEIPTPDASADLVLYREMLYLVRDLVTILTECGRVLKPTGRAIVSQLFSTDWLEPEESKRFWGAIEARNADIEHFERSVAAAGLAVEDVLDLRSETVEWAEEQDGKAGRELLAAARLIRDPQRYIARFGREAYDIKLNDALWFVYRMIGKLTQRIYVLRPASR